MNAAKLKNFEMQNNSELTIAHIASPNPFYYVEEAEMKGGKVEVVFFNENDPESELEYIKIPTSELIDFTNEFYSSYHDGERLPDAGIDYLIDNLKAVVTDFINAKK